MRNASLITVIVALLFLDIKTSGKDKKNRMLLNYYN